MIKHLDPPRESGDLGSSPSHAFLVGGMGIKQQIAGFSSDVGAH
ncbi:hypothetical protein [Neosynechococcus sphagnicola]|nr:hypothetical protein [Neosynechococcus sphagnicola]